MNPEFDVNIVSHVEPKKYDDIQLTCERKDLLDKELYYQDVDIYLEELRTYQNKSWIKRLFTKRPVPPRTEDYIRF